jgi:hypothetical protein
MKQIADAIRNAKINMFTDCKSEEEAMKYVMDLLGLEEDTFTLTALMVYRNTILNEIAAAVERLECSQSDKKN